MTNISDLCRTFEAAKASGTNIIISPDDLSAMLQFASLMGDPTRSPIVFPAPPAPAPVKEPVEMFISIEETARLLRMCIKTLWKMRRNDPTFPKPVRTSAGRKHFYRSEIDGWAAAQR